LLLKSIFSVYFDSHCAIGPRQPRALKIFPITTAKPQAPIKVAKVATVLPVKFKNALLLNIKPADKPMYMPKVCRPAGESHSAQAGTRFNR
jgi:hypothetical protein